jgi:hypothetical protein
MACVFEHNVRLPSSGRILETKQRILWNILFLNYASGISGVVYLCLLGIYFTILVITVG